MSPRANQRDTFPFPHWSWVLSGIMEAGASQEQGRLVPRSGFRTRVLFSSFLVYVFFIILCFGEGAGLFGSLDGPSLVIVLSSGLVHESSEPAWPSWSRPELAEGKFFF